MTGVCFADKLQKEECKIDWNKSAQEIHNLVRGVYKCPSAHFEYQGKIIKVLETKPLNETLDAKFYDKEIDKVENDGVYYEFEFTDDSEAKIKTNGQVLEFDIN